MVICTRPVCYLMQSADGDELQPACSAIASGLTHLDVVFLFLLTLVSDFSAQVIQAVQRGLQSLQFLFVSAAMRLHDKSGFECSKYPLIVLQLQASRLTSHSNKTRQALLSQVIIPCSAQSMHIPAAHRCYDAAGLGCQGWQVLHQAGSPAAEGI